MKFAFGLLTLVIAMQAHAADSLGLEKGFVGLSWGEEASIIRRQFPQASVAANGEHVATLAVKGEFSFAGHAVDVVVATFDPSNRLNGLMFSIRPSEQNVFLQQLRAALGEPRAMRMKEADLYDQYLEWNRAQFSVSVWAVTRGPQLTDEVAKPVSVHLWLGPLVSQIDDVEKQKKALRERFGTDIPQR